MKEGLWIPKETLKRMDLNMSEKSVLAMIQSFSKSSGKCTTRNTTLSEALGVAVRTVERAIGTLKKKGFIRVEGGGLYRTIYPERLEFIPDKVAELNRQNGGVKPPKWRSQTDKVAELNRQNGGVPYIDNKESNKEIVKGEKEASPLALPELNYQEVLNDKRRTYQEFKKAVPDEWADFE